MKAKKFKQFVTEALNRRHAEISAEVDECVFVINDTVYFMTVELDADTHTEKADPEVGIPHSWTGVNVWWLSDILFCEKFTDPEINQQILKQLATTVKNMDRLKELGITDKPNTATISNIIWKALNEYPMEEVSDAEVSQIQAILAKQIDDSSYQDLTGSFEKQAIKALEYALDRNFN